jgi:hypothetical protein
MKRITAVCVIASPVIFLIANVLHPKEYRRNHEAQQLQTIHDHYQRWQIAHFLTFVAIMLFVFAVVGLAWMLYERRPAQALFGGGLGLVGLVAIGGVLALDGFTWAALGQVWGWPSVDHHTLVLALHAVQQSHWNLPFYVGSLAWLIGLVILAWGLIAERLVSRWAGWTFAAGAVLVGIEAGVQNNAYFIVAAAVLAAGGIGVGLALRHDDDSTRIGHAPAG